MTLATFLLVALGAAQVSPSHDEAPVRSSDTLTAPPLMATPEACPPESETLYKEGFDALSKGDDEEAAERFRQVLELCPQHSHAPELERLARARLKPGAKLAQAAVFENTERPTRGAAASLTVIQTMHGAVQGLLLCAIAECADRAYPASALLGAGLGTLSTLLLVQDGVTPGQASVINSGTMWGLYFGVASLIALDLEEDEAFGSVALGGAAFTGIGIVLATTLKPTAGQVSMANSGGLWAGVLTTLFLGTVDGESTETLFGAQMASASAGIIAFSLLSRNLPVSRGRMLIIDAGGIIGGLMGASSMLLLTGNNDEDPILIGTGIGVMGGLALTAYLTRNFDARRLPPVAVTPTLMGRNGAGLAMGGQF
ncbi:hypothetical protein [Myxococcus faecalis]|uniref:hypothetical protein n=1 Tax=Myxococcus faecalis TaxID=3115646 RepID=UPI003CEF3AD2